MIRIYITYYLLVGAGLILFLITNHPDILVATILATIPIPLLHLILRKDAHRSQKESKGTLYIDGAGGAYAEFEVSPENLPSGMTVSMVVKTI